MSNNGYLPFISFLFPILVKSKNSRMRYTKKARLTYFKMKLKAVDKSELEEEPPETSY